MVRKNKTKRRRHRNGGKNIHSPDSVNKVSYKTSELSISPYLDSNKLISNVEKDLNFGASVETIPRIINTKIIKPTKALTLNNPKRRGLWSKFKGAFTRKRNKIQPLGGKNKRKNKSKRRRKSKSKSKSKSK